MEGIVPDNSAVIVDNSDPSDDLGWADRCAYWHKKSTPKTGNFKRRAGVRQPLVLTGHGVRLRIDRGSLHVRNGLTHYPQQPETWRFFSGDWRLPSRIVVLDVDGGVSFDALSWLSEHDVALVQVNWRGDVINVVASKPETTIPERVRSQLRARTKDGGLQFSLRLMRQKTSNSIETLHYAFPRSATIDSAIRKLKAHLAALTNNPPDTLSGLMGIEGGVAVTYFAAWRAYPLRWKGLDRHPVPDEWRQIGRRVSKVGTPSQRNRNATHPVNAMLNYAYGILESQVRMQVVAAGLDPTIGYLHGDRHGKHGLVYDLMEPLRPMVDRRVLGFVQSRTFHEADFMLRSDGVCRLNPQLARQVVQLTSSNPTFSRGH